MTGSSILTTTMDGKLNGYTHKIPFKGCENPHSRLYFLLDKTMKTKALNWKIFVITLLINLVGITLLAWWGNQVLHSKVELLCRQQMQTLQQAVNNYNKSNPSDKKTSMEFGFPGFVETVLIPGKYISGTIQDLRGNHSYYLQRNGFVNCRLHPRNPPSLYWMGIIILSLIFSTLELGFLGYQIPWKG
jgi:hypothetical protein